MRKHAIILAAIVALVPPTIIVKSAKAASIFENFTNGIQDADNVGNKNASNPYATPSGTQIEGTKSNILGQIEQTIDNLSDKPASPVYEEPSVADNGLKRPENLGTLEDMGSWEQPIAAPGQRLPGILRYIVDAGSAASELMTIRVQNRQVTDISFPACERIVDFQAVDSKGVKYKLAGLVGGDWLEFTPVDERRFYLQPKANAEDGAISNLTLQGASGTTYRFIIQKLPSSTTWTPDIGVIVSFKNEQAYCTRSDRGLRRSNGANLLTNNQSIPDVLKGEDMDTNVLAGNGSLAGSTADAVRPEWAQYTPFDAEQLELNSSEFTAYISRPEDAIIAPESISHDGRFMYLDMGEKVYNNIPFPTAFIHEANGIDTLANQWRIGKGGRILKVEAYGELTLSAEGHVVCVRSNKKVDFANSNIILDRNLGKR